MDNYQIVSKIYESSNSLVYRAVSLNVENLSPPRREVLISPPSLAGKGAGGLGFPNSVILKILKEDYPSPSELTRYKQEYEITRSLQIDGAIKVYDLLPYKNTLAMVLEDFGGQSLDILLQSQTFSLAEFLSIAIQIAQALSEIHAANIIHKDINPSNIVYNPQTGQVKIIDFGIATKFTRENPTLKNPNLLEGTLAYMSPEQTGRMNRSLDCRTDFYSLGATFYRLLTQKLPFETEDPLELVHCHIAKKPIPPHELNLAVPIAVSNMVMKLLAKTSEERYQNTLGLKADLEECLTQLEQNGEIIEFPLAGSDISDRFTIPQKLYGREAQIKTLLSTFQRIAEGTGQRSTEMVLIGGYAGIGKSVLVQELYKPITQQRGYFISGKFDQFQRNIPYSAIASAFKSLVQQLLTESDAQLAQWREKLLTAFGANGQVIIDLIPEIEQIVGSQPPVQLLEPTETQNRFNTVFVNFLQVFCQQAHPLVIFLDDLQWADSATLKLLEVMMSDRDLGYLMCIGAYRDREVDLNHPLIKMRDRLQEKGAIVNTISLTPLQLEEIAQLISDALHQEQDSVKTLAELIAQKTSGNPFFINEFLKTIYQENLLTFDHSSQSWQWDIAQIETLGITDNVVDLMLDKLRKLPEATQQALYLAACIGNSFALTTLSQICENSAPQTFQNLLPAIQLGLIQPTSSLENTSSEALIESALIVEEYKFQHDRVQQAAYALIDDERKQSVHLKIGRLLLKQLGVAELGEKLFTLVDHLNKGRALRSSDSEKIQLAELNLRAGKKAKEATAYAASREYLILANDVFPGNIWQERYAMAIDLYKELAEVEYLNGNFDRSEALIEQSIQQAESAVEKAEFYYLRINQYTLLGRYKEAIEVGMTALKLLGSDLPEDNFQSAFDREISEYRENLGARAINFLYSIPEMEIPEKRAALKILCSIFPTAWAVNPILMNIIAVKAVNLNLKYGHTQVSPTIYGFMGFIIAHVLHDYRSGYEYTSLGMKLADKYKNLGSKAVVTQGHANLISPWLMPIKLCESINAEGADAGLQAGDLQATGYIFTYNLYNLIYQGKNLELLLQEVSRSLEFARKTQNSWAKNSILAANIIIQNLLGLTEDKFCFAIEQIDESAFLSTCKTEQTLAAICFYQIFKAQILYLYGQPPELSDLEETEKLTAFIPGTISTAKHNFYYSLTLAALYPQASATEKEKYWQKLEANQERLKKWAEQCPENFQHQYLLVAAEMTRLLGQWYEAINLYDQAIKSAKENEFIHDEALANELTAKFWFAQEKAEFAQIHLKKARQGYQIWGAKRKVEDLDEKYPQWLRSTATESPPTTIKTVTTTGKNSGKALDLAAVMKASQAISGEIVLEQLLKKLMKTVIESAGAEKGFLILDKGMNGSIPTLQEDLIVRASCSLMGIREQDARTTNLQKWDAPGMNWVIEAEGVVNAEQVTAMQSIPINAINADSQIPILSTAIINYVARTQENVVLNDAAHEGAYTRDPYIIATQPKSILCTPIIHQSQLIGLLYLENNLTTDAFTDDRLEVLKILSSQAAISIKNAQLYEQTTALNINLQQEVIERRRAEEALAESNRNLEFKIEERTVQLKEAKEVADAANQAKSEFLSNMSHELRTPLNGILGYAQILQRSSMMPQEERQGISVIHQCGSHLLTLINDILDLSKIEARKMELYPTEFHFPAFLEGVAEICRIRAEQKGITFIYQTASELPQRVNADEKRLRQVLINLIGNAIKFTDTGGVTFKVGVIDRNPHPKSLSHGERDFEVLLPFSQWEKGLGDEGCFSSCKPDMLSNSNSSSITKIRFQVEDTGIGMSPEQLNKIFLPFEQVSDEARKTEGTGLGLAISQNIIAMMGSTIQVSSQLNQGSVFWIDLDLSEVKGWEQTQTTLVQKQVTGYTGSQRKILVVDDRWENRMVIINLLQPIGFVIAEATNGNEGLEKAKAFKPDLIILDLIMPEMDGFEMMRSLRQSDELKQVAIVASSARVYESDRTQSLAAGANDFLPKPVQIEDLLQKVQKHLSLEWVYENMEERSVSSTSELVAPPEAELALLFNLAKKGRIQGILAQADRIEKLNDEFIPFAQQIRQLAKGFKVPQLQVFIQQYLNIPK